MIRKGLFSGNQFATAYTNNLSCYPDININLS